jgi:threonine aldolase
MAMKLVDAIENKGYKFYTKPESNQIFPILPNNVIERLKKDFDFYIWEKVDEKNSAIRLVTSWATSEEQVEQFINTLNNI